MTDGPWTKYQAADQPTGPWTKYADKATQQESASPLSRVVPAIKEEYEGGRSLAASGVSDLTSKPGPTGGFGRNLKGLGKIILGEMQEVGSPVEGTLTALAEEPVTKATGSPYAGMAAKTVAGVAAPFAASKVAREVPGAVRSIADAIPKAAPAATPQSVAAAASDMQKAAGKYYAKATSRGGILNTKFTDDFVNRSIAKLPQSPASQAFSGDSESTKLLQRLENLRGQQLSLKGVQEVDEEMSDMIAKEYNAQGRLSKYGYRLQGIQDDLRQSVENAGPQHIVSGPTGFQALKDGRKAWSQAMKLRDMQKAVETAANSDNPAATLRRSLRTMLNNPRRMRAYSADEVASMKRAAQSGAVNELMSKVSARLAAEIGAGVGAIAGGVPGAVAGAGAGLGLQSMGRSAMTTQQMRRLQSVIGQVQQNAP